MMCKPLTYSLSLKLQSNFSGALENSCFYIPAFIIKEIFDRISDETCKTQRNVLLSCRSFLFIGLKAFQSSLYSERVLLKICRIQGEVATFHHSVQKNKNSRKALTIAIEEGYLKPFAALKNIIKWSEAVSFIFSLEQKPHRVSVLKQVLLDPTFDPMTENNLLFRKALESKDIPVLDLLLNDSRFNPSCNNNEIIAFALNPDLYNEDISFIEKYVVNFVCRMAFDPRVVPSSDNNRILIEALKNVHYWHLVVDKLIKHPLIDLSVNFDALMSYATKHTNLLHLLIPEELPNDSEISTRNLDSFVVISNYTNIDNKIKAADLLEALDQNDSNQKPGDILAKFLKDPERVIELCDLDDILNLDLPLKLKNECVDKIMNRPDFEPSENNNLLLKILMKHYLFLPINKLLKHPKVNFNIDREELILLSEQYRLQVLSTTNTGVMYELLTKYLCDFDFDNKN